MIARYKVRPNGVVWSVQYVYRGARLVWEAIRSCYGKGYWAEERSWIDEDGWKD